MANKTAPLTDTEIRQAKAKDKEYNFGDCKGLLLGVKPNSSKLWLFNYQRPYTKKRAILSIGSYPEIPLGLFINPQLCYQEMRADAGNCLLAHPQTASNVLLLKQRASYSSTSSRLYLT